MKELTDKDMETFIEIIRKIRNQYSEMGKRDMESKAFMFPSPQMIGEMELEIAQHAENAAKELERVRRLMTEIRNAI